MSILTVARQWHRAWVEQQQLGLTYNCDVCGEPYPEDELTTTMDGQARLCNYCYANEEYDTLTEAHPTGPFFHASSQKFNPGDKLLPLFERTDEAEMEFWEMDAGEEFDGAWVFFTNDSNKAHQYALYGRGPYVYEVQPNGTIYHDPNSPFDMADQYVAESATVLRQIAGPGWRKDAGSSWRAMAPDDPWNQYRAVIFTDGGPSGRKGYEVYLEGDLIATRDSLASAKQVIEDRIGPAQWNVKRIEPMEVVHYYFGPTTEFSSPTTIWVVP